MEKNEEYEKMVQSHKEVLSEFKLEEEKKEAKVNLVALIITIPITFYIFGKICAWIAGTTIIIGPFTFNW